LKAEGLKTSYLRLRALPFEATTTDFVKRFDRIYVVENNTDGQMAKLLRMEYPEQAARFRSLAMSNGLPLTPRWVTRSILEQES